jgi:hypothetical protein
MSLYVYLSVCSALNSLQMQCTVVLEGRRETKENHDEYRAEYQSSRLRFELGKFMKVCVYGWGGGGQT